MALDEKAAKIDASYLSRVFYVEDFRKIIDRAAESLRLFDAQYPFDAIAFCGMSGSALAYPLSYMLKKHLLCVRKPDRTVSHSSHKVEGVINAKTYIIVDDCIDSGATVKRIREAVSTAKTWDSDRGNYVNMDTKLIGIYLYMGMDFATGPWQKSNPDVHIIHAPWTLNEGNRV